MVGDKIPKKDPSQEKNASAWTWTPRQVPIQAPETLEVSEQPQLSQRRQPRWEDDPVLKAARQRIKEKQASRTEASDEAIQSSSKETQQLNEEAQDKTPPPVLSSENENRSQLQLAAVSTDAPLTGIKEQPESEKQPAPDELASGGATSASVSRTGHSLPDNKFPPNGTTSTTVAVATVAAVTVFSFITIVIVAGAVVIYWNYTERDRQEVFQVAWDWASRTTAQLQEDTSRIAGQIIDNLQKQLDSLAAKFGSVVIEPLKNFLAENAANAQTEIQRRLEELINSLKPESKPIVPGSPLPTIPNDQQLNAPGSPAQPVPLPTSLPTEQQQASSQSPTNLNSQENYAQRIENIYRDIQEIKKEAASRVANLNAETQGIQEESASRVASIRRDIQQIQDEAAA